MAFGNENPFYKDMKAALQENRFDRKSKQTPQDKLAALERRLDREKLTPGEIQSIRDQIAKLQDYIATHKPR